MTKVVGFFICFLSTKLQSHYLQKHSNINSKNRFLTHSSKRKAIL